MRRYFASARDNSNLNISNLKKIRRFGDEQIKKELESVAGVASVKVSGGLEERRSRYSHRTRTDFGILKFSDRTSYTQILSAEKM
ncbi:MAG: hypothetical protein U5K69_24240 [Balneolaceae bacterium]|nr:hypothetical protein [Balneolaceae bacterium]